MADAQASGACGRKIVWVQVPSSALLYKMQEWRNWQTRRLQVPVVARSCGFKSHLLHYFFALNSYNYSKKEPSVADDSFFILLSVRSGNPEICPDQRVALCTVTEDWCNIIIIIFVVLELFSPEFLKYNLLARLNSCYFFVS